MEQESKKQVFKNVIKQDSSQAKKSKESKLYGNKASDENEINLATEKARNCKHAFN